jgi:Ca2+-binding EF-hand superfamily protein
MRHEAKLIGAAAAAGIAASAFGHGPMPGSMMPDARMSAMLLAAAADADRSRNVTADEWAAFLAAVDTDGDGVVELDALRAALPEPPEPPRDGMDVSTLLAHMFDADRDGTVETEDLNALFSSLDRNGDGALDSDDLPPPPEDGAGDGGHPRPGPMPDALRIAHLLARVADADGDRDVTQEEWDAFLATLGAGDDGAIDMDALLAALPDVPGCHDDDEDHVARLGDLLDHDGDGVVSLDDLNWFFSLLDRNEDGTAEKSEAKPLRGRARRAAGALFRAADADESGDVTADEWSAFLAGLAVDENGAVSLDDLASKVRGPRFPRGEDDDTSRRDRALTRAYDRDGDGVVEVSDLQAIFDLADADADGALGSTELRPRR